MFCVIPRQRSSLHLQPEINQQLMSRCRFACSTNYPIRLFQNVGIFRLLSRRKTEHYECRAKKNAYQHNLPVGASVSTAKRTRHRINIPQRESKAALQRDRFRTASRQWKMVSSDRHLDCATGGGCGHIVGVLVIQSTAQFGGLECRDDVRGRCESATVSVWPPMR